MNYIQEVANAIRANVSPDIIPEDSDDLFRLYALLLLSKRESTDLEDIHTAWATWMSGVNPEHESLRPFSELSEDVQSQDKPYLDAVLTTLKAIDIS